MSIAASLKLLLPPILYRPLAEIVEAIRTIVVRAQLRGHSQLHLACGKNRIPGWANIDLNAADGVIGWNLTRPLPVADASIRFIYSEHFIEHIPNAAARSLLRECHRVLQPGGVLRLSTPDLEFMLQEYAAKRLGEWHDMGWKPSTPCQMVNEGMRLWGHEYVYDANELEHLLRESGFNQVRFSGWRDSNHETLRNLECRPFHRELIIEATRG